MRRVVLEAAVMRRVVRRRDDDAVGGASAALAIVLDDGLRDRRGGVVWSFVASITSTPWAASTSSVLMLAGVAVAGFPARGLAGPVGPVGLGMAWGLSVKGCSAPDRTQHDLALVMPRYPGAGAVRRAPPHPQHMGAFRCG